MRSLAVASLALGLVLALGIAASADDGDLGFRRTTPRAALATGGGAVVMGVPGGRAWGVESAARALPPPGTILVVRLAVTDPVVREAFVRVAYYASAVRRTRQLAIADSEPVAAGRRMLVAVEIDPPPGAVAYRVRVLARLFEATARSSDEAVTAVFGDSRGASGHFGSLYSRLLP